MDADVQQYAAGGLGFAEEGVGGGLPPEFAAFFDGEVFEPPQRLLLQDAFEGFARGEEAFVEPDGQERVRGAGGVDHALGLGDAGGHRFFAQDGGSVLHRVEGGLGVEFRRGGDDDQARAEVGVFEPGVLPGLGEEFSERLAVGGRGVHQRFHGQEPARLQFGERGAVEEPADCAAADEYGGDGVVAHEVWRF